MAGEINQQDLKEFYDKGILAFEKKNYDYAIEIFSQILSSKYDHLEARHYLHLSLKNKAGSVTQSFITNTLNSINRFLGTLSAEALVKKGNVSEALERLEKIIAGNPGDIHTLKKIAEIFYKKDLIPHAVQNLEEAKSIAPKDISVLKKLGEIYLRKEDYKNAKSNYETALKINPGDTEVLRSLKNLDALGTIQREFEN
ncbi:MAG: tetratricopeptide repeat protein [Candidatus Omnitrophica bacterium]|nr:tetratricopeptide repeat protein [Candidatus Omnitrophota bacterium]